MSNKKKIVSGIKFFDNLTQGGIDAKKIYITDAYKIPHYKSWPLQIEKDENGNVKEVIIFGSDKGGSIAAAQNSIQHVLFLFDERKAAIITEEGKCIIRETLDLLDKEGIDYSHLIKKNIYGL